MGAAVVQRLPGVTCRNHENLDHDIRSPVRVMNPRRPKPQTISTNQTAAIGVKQVKRRKAHLRIACTAMCQSRVDDVHRTHRRATGGMFCNLSFWNRDRPVWEQPDLLDPPALCSIISNCYVTVAITPERNFRRWFSLHVYILSCSPKHYVIAASWTPVVTSPPNNGLQLQKLLTGSK